MTSQHLSTAKRYIGHFAALDTQTLDEILADNFVQEMEPASLNLSNFTNKQSFIEHIRHLQKIMSAFPVTAKEYVNGENAVTVWATSRTFFRDEVKDEGIAAEEWEYEGEYIFILFMDATGEKIVRVVEFLDSKKTGAQLQPLMKRARENLKKIEATKEK
jgi:ketosteroid isomerase-like protein